MTLDTVVSHRVTKHLHASLDRVEAHPTTMGPLR
jgi:hypothetical protein